MIDRYAARPVNLENLCLGQIVANYDTIYGAKENDDDIIPNQLDTENGDKQSNTIILKKGLGKTRCNYLPEAGSVAPPSSFWPMLTVQWFNIIR